RADAAWVDELLGDEFFQRPAPKSAGREQFGAAYVERLMAHRRAQHAAKEDLLATGVELTAQAIARAAARPPLAPGAVDAVYVAGGGRHNRTLVARLSALLRPARVAGFEVLGLDPDAKEAVDFAVLANETLLGHAGNLPSVTGATRPCILGTI